MLHITPMFRRRWRIAAIAFADGDDGFIIGVDGRPGMLFQFKHRVPSVVRRFWEEKYCHLQPPGPEGLNREYVML